MADSPAAEVPVSNPTTGEIRMVPREGVKAFTEQTGWHVSTADQREVAAENLESGSTGQQALAAGEQVVRTGTLGLAPGMEGWQQREKVLRRESPVISGIAQGAGAVLPAVVTGGLAGGLAGAAGLGARGVALAGAVGEGFAGGLSDEVEQARYETRDVSLGNVMLYGVGGELVGRALPHAFSLGAGKIKRALTGAEAAAGEGLTDALVTAEERAGRSQADLATELPKGSTERSEALRSTAPQQYDRMATAAAGDLDQIADLTSKMGDTSDSPKVVSRLRESLADESPAQTDFFTGVKTRLDDAKKTLRAVEERAGSASPVNLEKKTLEDLSALPIDDAADRARVEALKQNPDFAKTGRVTSNDGKQGITLVNDGGDLMLRDGRHRLTAAQELGIETVYGRYVDGESGKVLYEGDIPLRKVEGSGALADAPGLKPFAKRFDQIVDSAQRKLDKTLDTADSFLISRDAKKQLEQLSAEMGRKAPQDAAAQRAFQAVIDDAHSSISAGLKDRALFGGAADIEAELSGPWREKISRGMGTTEGDLARKVEVDPKTGRTLAEFDPKKVRSFLQGDAIDRQLSQGKLEQVLEGAEEMAAAHERHGTWNPDQIQKLRDAVGRVREKLSLADELQTAKNAVVEKTGGKAEKSLGQHAAEQVKGYAVSRAAGAAGAAAGGLIGGPVGAALGWGVGEVASSVGRRLVGLDAAARNATKQAARNLAGVGLGYAERLAGKAASGVAGGALAAGTMTALARFQGDYPDAQASFEAKRKVLDQQQIQPEVLYETLGAALGDLPKVRPDLFQAIAQRTSEKVRFVRENLPPGLQASLLYPNGTPPSTSDLRDFATLWNTVMDPETVLHDINAGTATSQQMGILKKSDPEFYGQLRGDIIEMVGTHFKDVPTSTKASLDLLLGADGLAGPLYSSTAARYIGDATKAAQEQGQRPPPPPPGNKPTPGTSPAGLNAIQTSVTNRQAA